MTKLAVINIGNMVSGKLNEAILNYDSLICEDGEIIEKGIGLKPDGIDILIDAQGTTLIPGLIDTHIHVVLGDYTPRQKQVDFLESYTHGGITSVVSAGEGQHTPGRPHDPIAVKSLAIIAAKAFNHYFPNGMKVKAGTVLLEPGITETDFAEMAAHGVRYAKYGFGDYSDPRDGRSDINLAKSAGLKVMIHSGGTSLPDSRSADPDLIMELNPDICCHLNGGTTALDEKGVSEIITRTEMAFQIVQAGNLKAALQILKIASDSNALHRLCIGSDTPSGTGVIPLGIFKTICELSSLGGIKPEDAIALATYNNAKIFGLPGGSIMTGGPADIVICDAPVGSKAKDALEAISIGDIPAISCVIIDGKVRVAPSRNTNASSRSIKIQYL